MCRRFLTRSDSAQTPATSSRWTAAMARSPFRSYSASAVRFTRSTSTPRWSRVPAHVLRKISAHAWSPPFATPSSTGWAFRPALATHGYYLIFSIPRSPTGGSSPPMRASGQAVSSPSSIGAATCPRPGAPRWQSVQAPHKLRHGRATLVVLPRRSPCSLCHHGTSGLPSAAANSVKRAAPVRAAPFHG